MKGKMNLLIGGFLGVIVGWALGFLRLPFLEKNHSFWLGFGACLAIVVFVILLLFVWNKNLFLRRLIGKSESTSEVQEIGQAHKMTWLLVFFVILLGGVFSSWLIYKQNNNADFQAVYQKKALQEQRNLMETMTKNNAVLSLRNFLDDVEAELESNSKDSLSDQTIAKIARLSAAFQPYQYFEEDSFGTQKLSPERGALLLGLTQMTLDSTTFSKIKQQTDFSEAYLKKADLSHVNLSGIKLSGSNLWGAKLNQTNLNGAFMTNVNLAWAELNAANLEQANMNGINLSNAKLIQANVAGASLQWANLSSAMFNEANLTHADLLGTNLLQVNFSKTNLTKTNLNRAGVEEQWLEKLAAWQLIEPDSVRAYFEVKRDLSMKGILHTFHLEKIK